MEVQYPLVFFTLLLCLASGMLAIQGWLLITNKGTRKFHIASIVASVAVLVLGGFASFLHLHHWERIFNGFGHLTSGITQELIGIVVFAVVAVIVFVLLRRGAAEEGGSDRLTPQWAGVVALVVGIAMGFVTAHSYYMGSRPAWANPTLYLFYYSSEFILGSAGMLAMAAAFKQDEVVVKGLARLTLIAGVVSAVAMMACGFFYTTLSFPDVGIAYHTTDPTAPAANPEGTMAAALFGEGALLTWGGGIAIGSLAVACLGLAAMKKPEAALPLGACALACALVGGVAFRVVLYMVAVPYFVYF